MLDILIKAIGFIFIIIIGYIFKSKGIFQKEHARFLSFIIMNITLPCSLFSSVGHIDISSSLLMALVIGFGANILTILLGFIMAKNGTLIEKAIYMINMSGYNIGTFALPFVQSFFPSNLLAYVIMFDTGNAIMCLGGTYSVASSMVVKSKGIKIVIEFIKRLLSSVPFCTYVILFIMSLLNLTLPSQLISVTSIAGNANAFLAMLMIGISLEIKLDLSQVIKIRNILIGRYGLMILISVLVFIFLPVETAAKQMIVLSLFAPISSVAPVYSYMIDSKTPVPAAVSSLSMIISIITLTVLIIIFS